MAWPGAGECATKQRMNTRVGIHPTHAFMNASIALTFSIIL